MPSPRELKTANAPEMDWKDVAFAIILLTILVVAVLDFLSASLTLASITAVTAFAAIYRLRHPDQPTPPAVRQSFERDEHSDRTDFGLRNYGPEAALYIQIEVQMEGENGSLLEIEPRDPPIHLSEGEFVGFIHDDRIPDNGLSDLIGSTEDDVEGQINLYYSYVSPTGQRVPKEMTDEPKRDDETILGELKGPNQQPRRIEIEKLRDHCGR